MASMNRNKLKTYAPAARRDFIQAMTDRAAFYGLTPSKTEPAVVRGDVAVIAGRDYPRAIADKRKKLEARIERDGFEQAMEAMAYTWFNRLVAIRFMELHGYLDHGYRVLSHPEGKQTPEILEHAEHVELPGLKKDRVIDLKLEGNKESELYRLLLTAQCNALHKAMPFLFERIDDETELLLPDNLLHSDSLVRKLVEGIDEDDWKEVEIIGWLYQFYISERKDEVIGKVVASADIPAATQIFTPNWIVKYLVQNTLGRQWLATYPNSALRAQMEYYIEPAEQAPEVTDQVKAIIPTSLDPEALTMLDPACGSCHILVEGYDLFKAIYLERGYRLKDIPALILQKNLFGLEIDDRAAQLGAFALMMKARADDRRIFEGSTKPNVLALQESKELDATTITIALNAPINRNDQPRNYLFEEIEQAETPLLTRRALAEPGNISKVDIASLLDLFKNAKTAGSLVQVPEALARKFTEIEHRLDEVLVHGDLMHASAGSIKPLLQQGRLLAEHYQIVVANPPYMGRKGYNKALKSFVEREYPDTKADLYGCFIQRNLAFCAHAGFVGMITLPSWMFIAAFESLRTSLFEKASIDSFVHVGRGAFGSDFGSCCFAIRNLRLNQYVGTFKRLFDSPGSVASIDELQKRYFSAEPIHVSASHFAILPGCPIAYWIGQGVVNAFEQYAPLGATAKLVVGLFTCDNDRFLRLWHEVEFSKIGFGIGNRAEAQESGNTWFPHAKGGGFRKWFGNNEYVVFFEADGNAIREYRREVGQSYSLPGEAYYFQTGVTWSETTISTFSARYCDTGSISNVKGPIAFHKQPDILLAFLCSKVCAHLMNALNPTVNFNVGNVAALPFDDKVLSILGDRAKKLSSAALSIARADWDDHETSWSFQTLGVLRLRDVSVSESSRLWNERCIEQLALMKEIEEGNNGLFIDAYGLKDELSPDVSRDQITLYKPDRAEDSRRLLSYAIGCLMGRYSLDRPGLIHASNGDCEFGHNQYVTFSVDDDGIVPVLDKDWGFEDDLANRIIEWVGIAWPKEHLEENIKYVADGLGVTNGEQPREIIRRYLASGFYKHHLSIYKKRPIYWLFSSGKQRAFQCLVYLHRYNESTLARMRTEYVISLQGQFAARIEQIEGDKVQAASSSHRKKLQKEQDELKAKQVELAAFEEKLKHFADRKVSLNLNDGVKVNYGKFGDLVAEVDAITGGRDEE
jgi:hypothetical protein